MAVNYTVNARVFDLRKDHPQPNDCFLVDTNVWYWWTYSRASQTTRPPSTNQADSYPYYLDQAIAVGATILRSTHTLVEIASLIERSEAEIYSTTHHLRDFDRKSFRHQNDSIVKSYREEIEAVWEQIKSVTSPISQNLDDAICDRFVSETQIERLDGYDTLLLMLARDNSITNIVTDDGDFSTVHNISVYTANNKVISAAVRRSKLQPPRPAPA